MTLLLTLNHIISCCCYTFCPEEGTLTLRAAINVGCSGTWLCEVLHAVKCISNLKCHTLRCVFQTKYLYLYSTTPTKSLYTVYVRSSVAVSVYRQSISSAALLSNSVGNIHLVVAFSDRELVIEIKNGRKGHAKVTWTAQFIQPANHFGIISSCFCNYILHTGP